MIHNTYVIKLPLAIIDFESNNGLVINNIDRLLYYYISNNKQMVYLCKKKDS